MPERLPHLIRDAANRSDEDTAALLHALAAGCWPRGGGRHDPVAAQWLRRWSPRGITAPDPGTSAN